MCEKPKDDADTKTDDDKKSDRRSYYYDDAHGYEDFDPTDEIDDDLDEERSA